MIRYERDAPGELWAVTQVAVGAERAVFRVPLGTWDGDEPGPDGLLQTPVVVLPGSDWGDVAIVAAARSGDAHAQHVVPSGPALLAAADAGAEVLLVPDGNGRAMNVIRALGGRPLPALPFSDPEAIRGFLDGCYIDVDIAIPVVDDSTRDELRSLRATLRLDDVHHLVEVDPRPGLEGTGLTLHDAPLDALGSAVAGVLAGRLAAANRPWRADRS
jgi:hypothetical protein